MFGDALPVAADVEEVQRRLGETRLVGVSWAVDDLLLAILALEDLLGPLPGATSMATQNVM